MPTSKPWYASVTIWGSIIAMAAPLIGVAFHTSLSAGDAQTLADSLAAAGAGIGGIVALIGRLRATTTISPTPTSGK